MNSFFIGQRYYSEGEPELGLGMVDEISERTVTLLYPLCQEHRIYNIKSAPLKRFTLSVGDKLTDNNEQEANIEGVLEENHCLFYQTNNGVVPEMFLSSKLDLKGPQQRLLAKSADENSFFELRYQSYLQKRNYQAFKHKGFLSPKIRLLPHQVYVVSEVLKMNRPKVMLCDEVGLGKTIEASLILNAFIQRELIESALIVVPESLVNQWFVELFKKFHLTFETITNIESLESLSENSNKIIISSKFVEESLEIQSYLEQNNWDFLILDESHQFNLSNKEKPLTEILSRINKKTMATLLLSATPEVLGHLNLFNQLHFLDPQKYQDYDEFLKILDRSKEISKIISKENFSKVDAELLNYFDQKELDGFRDNWSIKKALIDRFGTGRAYFRNSRKNLENYQSIFNQRILHAKKLTTSKKLSDKTVFETKLSYLYELLKQLENEKVLVICHSKKIVLSLTKSLESLGNFKLANFHSDQTTLERDRQSVYFADEDGAQVLISTEIGAEGRNFEFAHHLVLFDLPQLPDQLEQRIGRLDRIGQTQNINIHLPYMAETFEESLFRWFNDVLDAFKTSPIGANEFYHQKREQFKNLLESTYNEQLLTSFLEICKKDYEKYKQDIEQGRDYLIEQNSYQDIEAKEITAEIINYETKNSPQSFLESVFEGLGIKHEELSENSFHIAPQDNMFIPSYPGLPSEGLSISYEREFSQRYENIHFMSWEHPIVLNAFEFLLNGTLGNSTITKNNKLTKNFYFEFIIKLQCSNQFKHLGELYLPLTPLRVLLSATAEDLTKKLPKKLLDPEHVKLSHKDLELFKKVPKEHILELFKSANRIGQKKKITFIDKAKTDISEYYSNEKARVKGLNLEETQEKLHLKKLTQTQSDVLTCVETAQCKIDAVRVFVPHI